MPDDSSARSPPRPARKPKGFGIVRRARWRGCKTLLAERKRPRRGCAWRCKGGGCSGLAYVMEWAETPRSGTRSSSGRRSRLRRSEELPVPDGLGAPLRGDPHGLRASSCENPNVKAACGCGESFTVWEPGRVRCWSCQTDVGAAERLPGLREGAAGRSGDHALRRLRASAAAWTSTGPRSSGRYRELSLQLHPDRFGAG